MFRRGPESIISPELSVAEQIERYADLLLLDPDGEARIAVSEHLLAAGAEVGSSVAKAEFYKKDGGYYIDEYRDHESTPAFSSYMMPIEQVYSAAEMPVGTVWATGMFRHERAHRSIFDIDNTLPVACVLRAYFGELPK